MRLIDKTVLITAATRGIGLACVKACAREGACVYMGARNPEQAEKSVAALKETGYQIHWVYQDAAKPETYSAMVDTVLEDAGRIDVLINNFGGSDPKQDLDFVHTPVDTFLDTVLLNLRSVYLASQLAAVPMRRQGGGSIINISSVGGMIPDISQVGYGTGKAAINHLTKIIALQEAKNGIRCNGILPGMTATDAVNDRLSNSFRALFLDHIPAGRMGTPEEIAAAAVYLASDESAYTTGQLLCISGGFGLGTPLYKDLGGKDFKRSDT